MADLLATLDLLDFLYLVLLGIGFLWALLLVLGQGFGEIDLPDMDIDAGDVPSFDQGEVGMGSISPMSIAGFMTAFGASGLVSGQSFAVSDGLSLVYATLGGLIVGILAQLLFIKVFSPQISSLRRTSDAVGLSAEVITSIPVEGPGRIAVVIRGSRATYSARSQTKEPIKQGTVVRILELVGDIAYVEPR